MFAGEVRLAITEAIWMKFLWETMHGMQILNMQFLSPDKEFFIFGNNHDYFIQKKFFI